MVLSQRIPMVVVKNPYNKALYLWDFGGGSFGNS